MIGQIAIHLLFGIAVTTTVLYALSLSSSAESSSRAVVARWLFRLLTAGLVGCAGTLITLILTHQFQYTYVWNYSSTELPTHLLIACFYSGQEGSFLLWTLFVAIIGVVLQPYAKRHGYEAPVMVFYGLILSFLTLLLVAKNPFSFYYETFAAKGITAIPEEIPLNGKGLNPLLHNAWITIHPPILFMGFASMSVSFAFAMAGLVRKEYHRWIDVALPWTLFATGVLGFGIMLGGFWAYETLGWGGFWGWDPVENSSLIPWLVVVALVHTMLVQKRTKGLVKTNMILALLGFVMVLYSTFLTRSGVLGDTSVHSFVDPGRFAFWILLLFMLTFVVIGVVLVLKRRVDMNIKREEFDVSTREFMLSIGSSLIMASAIFVTIGTSWPVIMEILGLPKVAVATDFYNKVHQVLVPFILLVNGFSLFMHWRSTQRQLVLQKLWRAALVAAIGTMILALFGISNLWPLALGFAAWFSLAVNIQVGSGLLKAGPAMMGAYVSHLGIALLMFGVITTAMYSETYHAVLVHGKPVSVGGYTLTYLGSEQVEKEFVDREKYRYFIRIENGDTRRTVAPVLYWSDYNQRQSPFLEPGIRWGMMNDLYISPKNLGREDVFHETIIQKNNTAVVPIDSSLRLQLNGFTMPLEEGPSDDGRMQMSAVLRVSDSSGNITDLKARTKITNGPNGPAFDPEWAVIPGTTTAVGLISIDRDNKDPSRSKGTFAFYDTTKPKPYARQEFTVEFSVKPLMSLVWIGVIAMVTGFGFSIARSLRMLKKQAAVRSTQLAPMPDVES
ncbi:MAG: hypothetical protein FJ211_04805 [Ignavibacteria bacterium]|nr:hypothetical protein [Ignavibacteria bacterium]